MRIAIIGTRGIPNNYGGFEQFAEYISTGLADNGHEVTVYNPHFHPYQEDTFGKVAIQKIYCPEAKLGSAGHFIYDYLSLKHAVKSGVDAIYAAGYGTLAPALTIMGRIPILVVNMDGIEWKRSKWNWATSRLMKLFERITVRRAAYIVSDNEGIREYYKTQFNRDSFFIAYGADPVYTFDASVLSAYGLQPHGYFLCIARLEPENNIETFLDGYCLATGHPEPFVVVGNYSLKYGQYLREKYKDRNVLFFGPIYEKHYLDNLRHFAKLYFHGHSVGGTNPSLLEAMATGCFIAAHDNSFNRSVLKDNALFFTDAKEVKTLLENLEPINDSIDMCIQSNYNTIRLDYSWKGIVAAHEQLFSFIKTQSTNEKIL